MTWPAPDPTTRIENLDWKLPIPYTKIILEPLPEITGTIGIIHDPHMPPGMAVLAPQSAIDRAYAELRADLEAQLYRIDPNS